MKKLLGLSTILGTLVTLSTTVAIAEQMIPINLQCRDGDRYSSTYRLYLTDIKLNKVERDYHQYDSDNCRVSFRNGEAHYNCDGLVTMSYARSANLRKQRMKYVAYRGAGNLEYYKASMVVTGGEMTGEINQAAAGKRAVKYSGVIHFNPKSVRCNRHDGLLCQTPDIGLKDFKPISLSFDGLAKKGVLLFQDGTTTPLNCVINHNIL
jgi:hypothetical protein